MSDKVDSLIESWAKGRAASVRESVDGNLEGFEHFTLTGKTDGPKSAFVSPDRLDPAGDICAKDTLASTPLDAAHAVREAVLAKGGKRPSVDSWKPVAAKVLGLSRLVKKRWQGVLDAGVEAGLFTIDAESLSYPILVACEITEPEPEIAPEPEPERKVEVEVSSKLPDDWTPPAVLPCGHTNWPQHGTTEDDPKQIAAREAGHCCAAYTAALERHNRMNPGNAGKPALSVQWRVRGLHEPVPEGKRRTPEREAGMGWPGLCCDPKTGLYIGGLGNNCRHYHNGPERCPVHASKGASK